MNYFKIILLCGFFSIFGYFIYYASKITKYNNEVIKVNIHLKNTCELADEAFMVVSSPEKKLAYFKDGISSLYLKRSSKIQLAASNKFPGFHYSGIPVIVSEKVDLVSNCTSSDRLDNIFDSLNKQFNN